MNNEAEQQPTRVLLIEDNLSDSVLIQHSLAKSGAVFKIDRVGRLSVALEQLNKEQVDVILLDLYLPDSQGLESIERLTQAAPTVPIIVLTGQDIEILATQALKTGAQDYLVKGQIEHQLLVRAIRYAIERKRVENELREDERRYRELFATATRQAQELTLLNQVRDALARELDLKATLRTIVEALAETFGYSHVSLYLLDGEESVLQHQVGYNHVIERVPISSGVSGRVLRTGQPVLVEDVNADPDFLAAVEKLVSEVCVPLFDQDKVVGFFNIESTSKVKLNQADLRLMVALSPLIGIAISRARLYTQMQESQARYRAVVEDQTEMICRFLPDGTVTFVNQAYCRVLFKTQQELVGQPLSVFMPALYKLIETQLGSLSDKHPSETRELQMVTPTEQIIWQRWTSRAIFDEHGQVSEIQMVGQDITDHKLAEEQRIQLAIEQQRVLALRQFINDVTHDLMTPISIINTSLYLARKMTDPQEQSTQFDLIDHHIDRLTKMVQEMLVMSELDLSVPKPLTYTSINMQHLIETIIENFRPAMTKKRLNVTQDVFSQGVQLPADEHSLSMVLTQLLDNAIKYTPDGGTIRLLSTDEERQISFAVADNGDGIADSDVPRIFDRFFRAQTHRPTNSGAGLGLSIVRRIVELYGGRIEVETALGKGSTFRVWFPIA